MPFKAYTPFELREIAYRDSCGIGCLKRNPFKQNTPEWNEWNLGWLVTRSQLAYMAGGCGYERKKT
jgi:hypothetical protein